MAQLNDTCSCTSHTIQGRAANVIFAKKAVKNHLGHERGDQTLLAQLAPKKAEEEAKGSTQKKAHPDNGLWCAYFYYSNMIETVCLATKQVFKIIPTSIMLWS